MTYVLLYDRGYDYEGEDSVPVAVFDNWGDALAAVEPLSGVHFKGYGDSEGISIWSISHNQPLWLASWRRETRGGEPRWKESGLNPPIAKEDQ